MTPAPLCTFHTHDSPHTPRLYHLGPQHERNLEWANQGDLGMSGSHRESLRFGGVDMSSNDEATAKHIGQMKTQVEYLEQLVKRQEIELNNYQAQYPGAKPADAGEVDAKMKEGLPPWMAPQALTPLVRIARRSVPTHACRQGSHQQP